MQDADSAFHTLAAGRRQLITLAEQESIELVPALEGKNIYNGLSPIT